MLEASGEAVGLPPGQMGNSEVGHLNLGAGRPVLQDLPRIDAAIARRVVLRPAGVHRGDGRARKAARGASTPSALVGPGGVHANDRHLVALAELAHRQGVPTVRVHALLDGRDTPPRPRWRTSATWRPASPPPIPDARIASVGGRYYAMDRDKRWERTERGYDAIVHGEAAHTRGRPIAAIEAAYARGRDRRVRRADGHRGRRRADGPLRVEDAEPIVHANFRADRARQLTHALADADFDGLRPAIGRAAGRRRQACSS